MASGGELGVDPELERAQIKLLEPADLGSSKRLGGDVGERGPLPELERLLGGAVGDPLIRIAPSTLDQALEPHRIHGLLGEL